MNNPKVSIGIPSYNHEKYISETIESILNQTFQDFEIIITDDGSSDNSLDVIKSFSDPRIKLFVFDENQGACKAVNNCIKNSRGEYFAYVSSDDVWEKDKLEKQVKFLDKNPHFPAVFTKVTIIDEDGKEFIDKNHFYFSVFEQENRSRSRWLNHFFYKGNCICHPSILIRKEVYNEIGYYNELMANLPDFDMWVRFSLMYDFHIIDEKLTKFRVRKDERNASGDKITTHIRVRFERLHILDHYLNINDEVFFLKIFPDAEKFGKLQPHMIPYFLARLAFETKYDFMQLWALNILFDFMQSNKIIDVLKKDYNFSYPDFLEMSSKGDFFKNKLLHKNELLKEEKNKERQKLLDLESKIRTLSRSKKGDILKNFQILFSKYNSNKIIPKKGKLARLSNIPYLFILVKSKGNLKNAMVNLKGYRAIKNLGLFDETYYLNKYKNVLISGMDPLIHYIYYGYNENKSPSALFDGKYYVNNNNDVKKSGINPLVHYSLYGVNHGEKMNNIKISVIVTSYNHEKYIKKCIDSILMQKGVDFEVIIGDDQSDDNTREILKEYKKNNHEIINLLPSNENLGVTKNLKRCFEVANGKYVAICEGDDYWTDSYKLQKQVKFLEERLDCVMCFNSILVYYENHKKKNHIQPKLSVDTLTTRELILNNYIGNFSSCMYRNSIIKKLPDHLYDLFTVDWMFNIACSEFGNIGFLNENMSVYRIHDSGLWSSKEAEKQISELMVLIDLYNEYYSFKYDLEFEKFKDRLIS